jgi:hypothetical protein
MRRPLEGRVPEAARPSVSTTRGNDTVAQCCQVPQSLLPFDPSTLLEPAGHPPNGGVANVDIAGNNTLQIKVIGVTISTFQPILKR